MFLPAFSSLTIFCKFYQGFTFQQLLKSYEGIFRKFLLMVNTRLRFLGDTRNSIDNSSAHFCDEKKKIELNDLIKARRPTFLFTFSCSPPQCQCRFADSVRNQRHHPWYGNICSFAATSANSRNRKASKGPVAADSNNNTYNEHSRR